MRLECVSSSRPPPERGVTHDLDFEAGRTPGLAYQAPLEVDANGHPVAIEHLVIQNKAASANAVPKPTET